MASRMFAGIVALSHSHKVIPIGTKVIKACLFVMYSLLL